MERERERERERGGEGEGGGGGGGGGREIIFVMVIKQVTCCHGIIITLL